MNFDEVIEAIMASGKRTNFLAPASEESISACETAMGRVIPKSYREWLAFSNGGEIFVPGTTFFGTTEGSNSLTSFNLNEFRSRFRMPEDLLIIGKLNYGDLLTIDCDNENAVLWDHELDEEYTYWDTFTEFLEDQFESFAEEND